MLIQGLFIFAFHCIGNTEVCIVIKQFEICVSIVIHNPTIPSCINIVILFCSKLFGITVNTLKKDGHSWEPVQDSPPWRCDGLNLKNVKFRHDLTAKYG